MPYDSSSAYASTVTTLHSFMYNDNQTSPNGGLLPYNGNLFGTTLDFDIGTPGTIFGLSGSDHTTFTTLYRFTGGADGWQPYAALYADGDGNLFGVTAVGGTYYDGNIFELKYVGTGVAGNVNGYAPAPTTLYSFSGPDGLFPSTNIVLDGEGNIYGTTVGGGSSNQDACPNIDADLGCGTFFELPKDSSTSTGYSSSLTPINAFTGGPDGDNPAYGLLIDGSGNIFGSAMGGGNSGCQGLLTLFGPAADPGCGAVFELANPFPLLFDNANDYAKLRIIEPSLTTTPGFQLQAEFDTSLGATFDPATQAVSLTVGSYTVSIPAGSFQVLKHGRYKGAWVYTGVINNVTVSVQIDPLGGSSYEFKANAFPVTLPANLTSINVSIHVGVNAGTISVTPLY